MKMPVKAKREAAPEKSRPIKRFVTRAYASEYLGVSCQTLSRWAAERTGPPWVKFGDGTTAAVRYPLDGLEAFAESHMKFPK
jgi:hypothetical protein